jgi:hypothetical protein
MSRKSYRKNYINYGLKAGILFKAKDLFFMVPDKMLQTVVSLMKNNSSAIFHCLQSNEYSLHFR